MYKLLALDMDGTLLNSHHQISEVNKKYLQLLHSKGVKIILISGREPDSLRSFSEELKIQDPLVGLNGSIITDYTGNKIYYEETIEESLVKKSIKLGQEHHTCSFVFIQNHIYTENKSDFRFKLFEKYTHSHIEEVGNLQDYLEKNHLWGRVNKILLTDNNGELLKYKEKLEEKTCRRLTIEFSLPIFLEIYNSKVSKGDALHKLCEILDLQRNEIVAVGDGENDLSMIQYAGLGVAMENATDILKKEANYITLSNDNNGISHVIQKFWNL